MTKDQTTFLELAVVKQLPYAKISAETGIPGKTLSLWWEELKPEREAISKIRQIWRKKCDVDKTEFWAFHTWFNSTERKCHYCGITEPQISQLIDSQKITTKRLTTRGKTLEIERIEPNKTYDEIDNLVYCCYWCNNAKTDEFTKKEFETIGKCIAEIWKNRLATI